LTDVGASCRKASSRDGVAAAASDIGWILNHVQDDKGRDIDNLPIW